MIRSIHLIILFEKKKRKKITLIRLNEMLFFDLHTNHLFDVFVFTEESVQRYDDALKKKQDENLLLRSSI